MYDASDRKDIRRAEKQARLGEQQDKEVVASIMSTTSGRGWMWRLLSSCHIFATTINRDPILMGFAEGERSKGLQLLTNVMSICPEEFIQMMREGEQRDAARERERQQPTESGTGEPADGGDPAESADGEVQ